MRKPKVPGLHNTMKDSEKMTDIETPIHDNPNQKLSKARVIVSRFRRKLMKHVWLMRAILIVAIVVIFVLVSALVLKPFEKTQLFYYASLGKIFLTTPESLIKLSESRTNILILGKGGIGHEAPDLTDTMMVASFNQKNGDIVLVSLPRDIWVPDLETKLNSVYYWGNQKKTGGGLILAKSVIEEISGKSIDYALVVDFSGFKNIVDVLGGIDVDVQNSFTDSKYPIAGRENDACDGDLEYKCRYETIKFEKGVVHMNGEIALKFVRSRNAQGDEGTDLARAARQQRVIESIKVKVLSRDVLLNPGKIVELKDALLSALETDLTPEAGAILARRVVDSKMKIRSYVLSENLLEVAPKSPVYQNLYVFIPKEIDLQSPSQRSWKEINNWFNCVLEANNNCS